MQEKKKKKKKQKKQKKKKKTQKDKKKKMRRPIPKSNHGSNSIMTLALKIMAIGKAIVGICMNHIISDCGVDELDEILWV